MISARAIIHNLISKTREDKIGWIPLSGPDLRTFQGNGAPVEFGFISDQEVQGKSFAIYVWGSPDADDDVVVQTPGLRVVDGGLHQQYEFGEDDAIDYSALWRLIKLAQRKAGKIDEFLVEFLGKDDSDENPFK